MRFHWLLSLRLIFIAGVLSVSLCWASPPTNDEKEQRESYADLSLAEINRRLENPLTSIWSLTLQENYTINAGDQVRGQEESNVLFFQPALPVPIGSRYTLIARPVFPLVTNPIIDPESGKRTERRTGLGDIQMLSLIGPDRTDGVVWGVGPTAKFPTATNDALGSEKYQLGPALMLLNLGKIWNYGIVAQHWWDIGGEDDRESVSRSEVQYIARRQISSLAMSVGMGPTVTMDWTADSDNQLTFPIGLGVTKTFKVGGTPIKARIEPQYSLIKPDDFGAEWNIRIQFVPVIPSPFKRQPVGE